MAARARGGGVPEGGVSHLEGREFRFHWLQEVHQEVDGACHACRQEVNEHMANMKIF